MSEIKRPIQAIEVQYTCTKCNAGTMIRRGSIVLLTAPPQYEHACTNKYCDHVRNFFKSYPSIEYQRIGDEATIDTGCEGLKGIQSTLDSILAEIESR